MNRALTIEQEQLVAAFLPGSRKEILNQLKMNFKDSDNPLKEIAENTVKRLETMSNEEFEELHIELEEE